MTNSYYEQVEKPRNIMIQSLRDNKAIFAVARHYKYGDERDVEVHEFKSKKALNDYYREIKSWLKADKGCSDKWSLVVEFSDGRILRGNIDC
jgi:hypothetical protein